MIKHEGRITPKEVLGKIDALKLQSCLTLFEKAVPNDPLFAEAFEALYLRNRDQRTLKMLANIA
jgi:uncharacterized protein (DUF1810 family)